VRDLQRRLAGAGVSTEHTVPGVFCPSTERAVRQFQTQRGLRADGSCGPQTWSALVEASYALGDRVLFHRSPMLRGDDVAELQRLLGRLGFDAGRVDGIYGPLTATALADFQRNVGLDGDGICGFDTLRALRRLRPRPEATAPVASVREDERWRTAPRTLAGHRLVVGQTGGLSALVRALGRSLRQAGATVITIDDSDGSRQAAAANHFDASAFLGFTGTSQRCSVAYYAVPGFESVGGRRLAEAMSVAIGRTLNTPPVSPCGMRMPVLRETRMPAVLCELGPVRIVTDHAREVSTALTEAVVSWVATAPPGLDHRVRT
jgi:N-acetylmuramoyl-L-alanine amidase